MYGFNNISPRWPALATSGGLSKKENSSNLARELMIGLGYQEILTFTMSNKDKLFSKMRLKTTEIIEISNPKTLSYTCLRNWLMPGVMEFLSHNTSVSYPQKIFEVGYCTVIDKKSETKTRDVRKLACVTCHTNASFTEIKEVATAFGINFGEEISIKEGKHLSFIDGRFGKILIDGKEVGILGEIHPAVLEEWKLENPVATLEIDLDKFFKKAEQR
jgi:phenylalanyl-tRNA synthetase beta chain